MKRLFFCLFCFFSPLTALEYSDFAQYQKQWSRSTIENKIHDYLQKDPEIENYFSLTDDALMIFHSPQAKVEGQEEFRIQLVPEDAYEHKKAAIPLTQAKIAIDPGHFGGWYARLEQRFVSFSYTDEHNEKHQIHYDEGTLAYLVALHLKKRLEATGAAVLVTRSGIGCGAFKEDFFTWLRQRPGLIGEKATLAQLFRKHYNPLDLKARAEKINAFHPDLTIVIHLNAHHEGLSDKNYDIAFLPGAFCKGELNDLSNRIEFLRLIVTEDLEHSERLCKLIVRQFESHLKVPHVKEEDGVAYLDKVCLKRDEGVYARNLCLTRLVHSPICYGETLIQNHLPEAIRLSQKDTEIEGIPCSSRLIEIGDAYFEAIVEYCEHADS